MIVDTETVNGNSSSIEKTDQEQQEGNLCKLNPSNSSQNNTTEPSAVKNSLIEKGNDDSLSDEPQETDQNDINQQESPEEVKNTSNSSENNTDISETAQNDITDQEKEASSEEVNVCKMNTSNNSENNTSGPSVVENSLIEKENDVSLSDESFQTENKTEDISEQTENLENNVEETDLSESARLENSVEPEALKEEKQNGDVVNTEETAQKQEENSEVVTENNVADPVETTEVKKSEEILTTTNNQTNGQEKEHQGKKVLNGTIANELIAEDYELPEVTKVKKHFEFLEVASHGQTHQLPKKGTLNTNLDIVAITRAYEDVRRDNSETQWAVFKYDGSKIIAAKTGVNFSDFESQFGDEDRAYGYLRLQTGDELSKRAKFVFITWVGPSVSPLKRAKMSTDKALIKEILSNFAVELQTENIADFTLENLENELLRAGGTHYGTGM